MPLDIFTDSFVLTSRRSCLKNLICFQIEGVVFCGEKVGKPCFEIKLITFLVNVCRSLTVNAKSAKNSPGALDVELLLDPFPRPPQYHVF